MRLRRIRTDSVESRPTPGGNMRCARTLLLFLLPAARRIRPGTRIVTWTEDCYDGAVTKPGQIPSKVVPPGHDNPQTGPFFVEGAEPGDTLVVKIEKLEPARDWAISSSFPGFGALNGTDRTALLGDRKSTRLNSSHM